MFQTYAIIGTGLSVLGIIYTYYFVRFLLSSKADTFSITSLSESLVTVFIGVFYIYSAIVLSMNMDKTPITNFPNTIDDIVSINTEELVTNSAIETTTKKYENEDMHNYTPTSEDSTIEENTEYTNFNEENASVTEYSDIGNENSSYTEQTVTETTMKSNTNDNFLLNYQNYIKNLIKQKLSNSSLNNRTVFFNNKEYRSLKIRKKRDIKLQTVDIPGDKCFFEIFITHALFLYTFLHCSLTMINNTLVCKEDRENVIEKKHEETSENKDFENDSEKNDNSAPIGPYFDETDRNAETIKNMFKARSAQCSKNVTNYEDKVDIQSEGTKKLKLVIYILFMWLLPIISVLVFYNILNQSRGTNQQTSYLNTLNFNSTQASPELITIIQNPTNISSVQESVEVKNILKSVYNIVSEVQQNTAYRKPHQSTPAMMDIVYFLNNQHRNPKDFQENCVIQEMSLKIYFFIFVVVYIIVILYAKVTQAAVKPENGKARDKLNMCILAFFILWLPSLLELFFRIFLTQSKPNILTDIFLTLGNTNRLFTMTTDYIKSKKIINKSSVVQPVV